MGIDIALARMSGFILEKTNQARNAISNALRLRYKPAKGLGERIMPINTMETRREIYGLGFEIFISFLIIAAIKINPKIISVK